MAKWENDGYCPNIWVPKTWDEATDSRIVGLWSLVGPSMVYEKEDSVSCEPDTSRCDRIFGADPISYDVLSAIVKKNVRADKIIIKQLHNGACNTQKLSDIQKVLSNSVNPELIVHAGSNFVVVLADAEYGLDLWVWDLTTCW